MKVVLLVETNASEKLRKVRREFVKTGSFADKLRDKFKNVKFSGWSKIGSDIKAVGSTALRWATALAGSFITINSNLEQLRIMMNNATGSIASGGKAMKDILDFSTKAPFSVDSLADSFVKLKVSGLDPLDGTMQTLTDSVAAFGGSSEQFKLVTIAIQQMVGKGVVSMEELRRQLGEQIPTAMRAMAKGMGMSLFNLVDKIKTGTLDAMTAIKPMLKVLNKWHGGAAAKRMDSFVGSVTRLKTEWTKLMLAVGKSDGAFKSISQTVLVAANALQKFRTSAEGTEIISSIANKIKNAFQELADNPAIFTSWAENIASSVDIAVTSLGGLKVVSVGTLGFVDALFGKTSAIMAKMAGVDFSTFYDPDVYAKARNQLKEITFLYGKLMQERSPLMDSGLSEQQVQAAKIQLKKLVDEVNGMKATIKIDVNDKEADQKIRAMKKKLVFTPVQSSTTFLSEMLGDFDKTYNKIFESYSKLADKLRDVNKTIFQDQLDLNNSLRNISREGMTDENAWKDKLAQIKEYRKQAVLAEKAKDIPKQVEYLKQAKRLVEGLNTAGITVDIIKKPDVERARQIYEYTKKTVYRETRGGRVSDPYNRVAKAKAKYIEALRLQNVDEKDVVTAKQQQLEKSKLLRAVGEDLLQITKDRKSILLKQKDDMKKQLQDKIDGISTALKTIQEANAAQDTLYNKWIKVGGNWIHITKGMEDSVQNLVQRLKSAYEVMEKLSKLSSSIPKLLNSKDIPKHASGGYVQKNSPVIVGDGGRPELFVPSTSGYVYPRVPNSGQSTSSVDINMNFSNGEKVTLQGSNQNVEDFMRIMSDQQRYAA